MASINQSVCYISENNAQIFIKLATWGGILTKF
jgi:hypothetical protein